MGSIPDSATKHKETTMAKWQPWTSIEDFPEELIGIPCLAQVDKGKREYEVLHVFLNGNGSPIGIVGGCFHFDRDIIRFKPLNVFIAEE